MDTLSAVKRDPAARAIVRAWRRLTTPRRSSRAGPGAPVLAACSGGADSSALALALAASRAPVTLAHVVHDLRAQAEALADRDAVRALAARLGLPFVEASVRVRAAGGNAEAQARRLRYDALARMAREAGVRFVATAHHAHDQVETVLMRLVRGAGPAGLAGIAERRGLPGSGPRLTLVRPMLGVTPNDARRLCGLAGVSWREDATNADTTRLRARIRAEVLGRVLALRPGVASRVTAAARVQGQAARVLRAHAAALDPACGAWARDVLRAQPAAVVGELLRCVGEGRAGARAIEAAARVIRSDATDPKVFTLGRVRVRVTAHRVCVEP